MQAIDPEACQALEYAITEPLPRLREVQHMRLAALSPQHRIVEDPSELASAPLPGFAFGNEILDALPFHIVEISRGTWRELHVRELNGVLVMDPHEIDPASPLAAQLNDLGDDFPDGYRTELRTNFTTFLGSIIPCLDDGTLIFFDYGFAAPEYYDPHRISGTLRTFSKHTAGEDPLDSPGERDITAHVDFTSLSLAAAKLGFQPTVFSSQGSYLTHLAKPMIMEGGLGDANRIAQFQSLTHPARLGASFHAIELRKKSAISPELIHRLAL
jgi:SAM-dependent MidA family methyltransferase